MEDGSILDAQITASSSYQETLVGPEKELLIFYMISIFFKNIDWSDGYLALINFGVKKMRIDIFVG